MAQPTAYSLSTETAGIIEDNKILSAEVRIGRKPLYARLPPYLIKSRSGLLIIAIMVRKMGTQCVLLIGRRLYDESLRV